MKPSELTRTIITINTAAPIESTVRSVAKVCVFFYVLGYSIGWAVHALNARLVNRPMPSYHRKPAAPYVHPLYHLSQLSCKDLHAMGYKGRRKIQQLASLIAA